jgi:NADH-quinone oxidoreductase subunit E
VIADGAFPRDDLEALRRHYPPGFDSSLVLPLLRRLQELRGFVADADVDALARELSVPRVQIEEVLSFYTQFRRSGAGRLHLKVCRNVSCSMRGADRLLAGLSRELGIAEGETTPDGRYTLSTVECLGSCGTAPVVMVHDAYHENVDVEALDAFLGKLG